MGVGFEKQTVWVASAGPGQGKHTAHDQDIVY